MDFFYIQEFKKNKNKKQKSVIFNWRTLRANLLLRVKEDTYSISS